MTGQYDDRSQAFALEWIKANLPPDVSPGIENMLMGELPNGQIELMDRNEVYEQLKNEPYEYYPRQEDNLNAQDFLKLAKMQPPAEPIDRFGTYHPKQMPEEYYSQAKAGCENFDTDGVAALQEEMGGLHSMFDGVDMEALRQLVGGEN